jgi:hypothetical protein
MENQLTYTFACDESGDPSLFFRKGASRYFVASIVATQQPEKVRMLFEELRLENKLPENYEFKFHNLSAIELQERIFNRISKTEIACWAIMVDKPSLPDQFKLMSGLDRYLYFLTELIRIIPDTARKNGTLILDEYGENSRMPVELRRVLKVRAISPGFKHCITRDSKDEPLIQLADLIAGAISHRDSDKRFNPYGEIERKLIKVLEYPLIKSNPPC